MSARIVRRRAGETLLWFIHFRYLLKHISFPLGDYVRTMLPERMLNENGVHSTEWETKVCFGTHVPFRAIPCWCVSNYNETN